MDLSSDHRSTFDRRLKVPPVAIIPQIGLPCEEPNNCGAVAGAMLLVTAGVLGFQGWVAGPGLMLHAAAPRVLTAGSLTEDTDAWEKTQKTGWVLSIHPQQALEEWSNVQRRVGAGVVGNGLWPIATKTRRRGRARQGRAKDHRREVYFERFPGLFGRNLYRRSARGGRLQPCSCPRTLDEWPLHGLWRCRFRKQIVEGGEDSKTAGPRSGSGRAARNWPRRGAPHSATDCSVMPNSVRIPVFNWPTASQTAGRSTGGELGMFSTQAELRPRA